MNKKKFKVKKKKLKRIPLNGNIVWYKNSRFVVAFSNSGSFFLLNVPKYLDTKPFFSPCANFM